MKKGEYGYGDIFLGIPVPKMREIVKKYSPPVLGTVSKLLKSKTHEHRMIGLLFLIQIYNESQNNKEKIFSFYLNHTKYINNWDLVDLSAPYIVGKFLLKSDKKIIFDLAKSSNLWERRIAIVSTLTFIRNGILTPTFKICKLLLKDKNDLIQKACGWMLREAGKKDKKRFKRFLMDNASKMPRTMLRYAIERLSQNERRFFLNLQ